MLRFSVVARSAIRPFRKNRVTCLFCNSAARSRNPRKNAPLGCCSFRKNTVTASALLLDATVSSRNPREKHSARRRRSPRNRPFRDSPRRCSNRLFPQENILESLVGCVLASFACQLDSAKVFTERRRSMGPDIAGPCAYR